MMLDSVYKTTLVSQFISLHNKWDGFCETIHEYEAVNEVFLNEGLLDYIGRFKKRGQFSGWNLLTEDIFSAVGDFNWIDWKHGKKFSSFN